MATAIATTSWTSGYVMSDYDKADLSGFEEFTLAGKWKYDLLGERVDPTTAETSMGFDILGNATVTYAQAYYNPDATDFSRSVYRIDYYDAPDGNVILSLTNFTPIDQFTFVWKNFLAPYDPPTINNSGDDVIDGANLNDALYGGEGADAVSGFGGNDQLFGGASRDDLFGGDGSDLIDGGGGGDIDTVYLAGFESDYVFKGNAQNFTAERAGFKDTIKNVEAVVFMDEGFKTLSSGSLKFFTPEQPKPPQEVFKGGSGADPLDGNEVNNEIYGRAGNDTLRGFGGDDELYGEVGRDTCYGGAGEDLFALTTRIGKSQADVFADFNAAEDTIGLSGAYFRKLGEGVGKSELRFGTKAKDANDYLIYNQKNGNLYYDSDGNGDKGQILIANIATKVKVSAFDFDIL